MSVLQSLTSLWKMKGEKSYCNTRYSYLVTHPSTNFAEQGLTLFKRRNMSLSLWYSDSTLNAWNEILILHGWESREQNSLALSGEDNSVSQTNNFVIVNVFNSVSSSCVTGNRNFARKEELIYETIAALTSNTILGDSTCIVLPSDIYGTKIPFPWCTMITW